jgi:hypothetical protein
LISLIDVTAFIGQAGLSILVWRMPLLTIRQLSLPGEK